MFAEVTKDLPVEHRRAARQRPRDGNGVGQTVGDLVEVAGVDGDVAIVDVDLDPGSVEFPLDLSSSRRASIASPMSLAVDANIGWMGRPTSMLTAASPSAPWVRAMTAAYPGRLATSPLGETRLA